MLSGILAWLDPTEKRENQMIRTNAMKNADFIPFKITDVDVYAASFENTHKSMAK